MFSSSTVSIGSSTKKSNFDQLLNNTQYNKGRLDTVYDGANTFAGAKTFSGAVTLSSTISIAGTVTLGGGLAVSGESTFQSATTFSSSISIDGASRVRVTKNNAQGMTFQVATIVQYDDEVFDNLGEFADYKFTAKEAGYYFVSAMLGSASRSWAANAYWELQIYKNGAHYSSGKTDRGDAYTGNKDGSITDIVQLDATEYIDIRCYQNMGSPLNTDASVYKGYLAIHRIS